MVQFDFDKFIDRTAEQELFEELASLEDSTRLMAIEDAGGRGKSSLLSALHYICTWKLEPIVPVCLIELRKDMTVFDLATEIHRQLGKLAGLAFSAFEESDKARREIYLRLVRQPALQGSVDMTSGKASDTSRQAGIQLNDNSILNLSVNLGGSDAAELAEHAREESITALLSDLRRISSSQTVAVLLDAYEKIEDNEELAEWITHRLMRPFCFDEAHRPPSFILVIAGRKVPNLMTMLSVDNYKRIVKSHLALGKWEFSHFKEFLHVHGYDLTDKYVELLFEKISEGWSLTNALQTAELLYTP